MDVAHQQFVAILLGKPIAVEIEQPAIRGLLMLLLDDRAQHPSVLRIGPALTEIVAGLAEVPQMVDHASAHEAGAFRVPGDAPGVARALAEEAELARSRIDAE